MTTSNLPFFSTITLLFLFPPLHQLYIYSYFCIHLFLTSLFFSFQFTSTTICDHPFILFTVSIFQHVFPALATCLSSLPSLPPPLVSDFLSVFYHFFIFHFYNFSSSTFSCLTSLLPRLHHLISYIISSSLFPSCSDIFFLPFFPPFVINM